MSVNEAASADVTTTQPRKRLLTMFAGWVIAFYGVRRRDVQGSITAMAGLGLAMGAMLVGRVPRTPTGARAASR